jgi:ornithine--oxo-acid transaminase
MTALDVLVKEDLVERSAKLGEIFRQGLRDLNSPFIKIIRGRGLFNGVVIDETVSKKGRTAWQLCLLMKSKG